MLWTLVRQWVLRRTALARQSPCWLQSRRCPVSMVLFGTLSHARIFRRSWRACREDPDGWGWWWVSGSRGGNSHRWHSAPPICKKSKANTVETLYSTIYYSKYFIEFNIDKSTQYVALWTHKRHPIPRPFGRAMKCLLWVQSSAAITRFLGSKKSLAL